MEKQCAGIKANGERCNRSADGSAGFCWGHDPKNAERRRRQASRAGRARPNKELQSIKARLSELADDVVEGRVETSVGAVTSQILNVYLRAISTELKVKEQQELENRLDELEALLAQRDRNAS